MTRPKIVQRSATKQQQWQIKESTVIGWIWLSDLRLLSPSLPSIPLPRPLSYEKLIPAQSDSTLSPSLSLLPSVLIRVSTHPPTMADGRWRMEDGAAAACLSGQMWVSVFLCGDTRPIPPTPTDKFTPTHAIPPPHSTCLYLTQWPYLGSLCGDVVFAVFIPLTPHPPPNPLLNPYCSSHPVQFIHPCVFVLKNIYSAGLKKVVTMPKQAKK